MTTGHRMHMATFLESGPASDYSDELDSPQRGEHVIPMEEVLEGGRAGWERFQKVAKLALKERPDKLGELVIASFSAGSSSRDVEASDLRTAREEN